MTADHEAFTYGIEEEFFLVHPGTRNLVPRVPKLFVQMCQRRLGACVQHELLQSQIEVSSPIYTSTREARERTIALRRGVADVAVAFGLRIAAAGTHPFAYWREQQHTDKPRYQRLQQDFQMLSLRSLVCGLHVHVAVPGRIDRVALMNRAAHWLPLFLALSTSSPFWNRRRTGLLSYRQAAYDEWPRSGIPDFFADEPEYRRFAQLLVDAGAMPNASYLWWAIRPPEAYPTLELRIADACTNASDALAIAALFRCLVAALVRDPALGRERSALTRRVIDENRWRCKRWGIEATLIDERGGPPRPLADAVGGLLELLAPEIAAFDCAAEIGALSRILAHGTSAHEQLAIYARERAAGGGRVEALRAVVDWLIAATAPENIGT